MVSPLKAFVVQQVSAASVAAGVFGIDAPGIDLV
jgi:hypothetical protein